MVENGIRVILTRGNSVFDISPYILDKGFPKEFRESLKSTGYFEYTAKSFNFNIITPIFDENMNAYYPLRYDRVEIYTDNSDSEKLFNGFIDEVSNSNDDEHYNVTIFPNAILLKDIEVGDLSIDDDGETNRKFDTDNQKHIRDIVQQLIDDVNSSTQNKAGAIFSTGTTEIPDMPDPPQQEPFIGSVLKKKKMGNYGWSASAYVFEQLAGENAGFTDKWHIRVKDGTHYLIRASAVKGSRTFISEGQWISWNFRLLSGVEFDWNTFRFMGINIPFGFSLTPTYRNFEYNIPQKDLDLHATCGKYTIYQLNGSSADYITHHEFAPLFPWFESQPNLTYLYGNKIQGTSSDNISNSKIRNFLVGKGVIGDSIEIITKCDINSSNTYVLATGRKKLKGNIFFDTRGYHFILLFETTFDEYYRCIYMNENASNIMKDLSKVGNRYFYVDPNNKVWMLPRRLTATDVIATNYAEMQNMISKKKKVHRESDVDIKIDRYEEDDEGEIKDYGIVLRKNEYEAIRKYYKDRFSHEREEYTIKFLAIDYDLKLLHNLVVRDGSIDVDYGVITSKGDAFREPLIEVTTEKYNV